MKRIFKTIALMMAALMLMGTLASCAFMGGGDMADYINDYINDLSDALGLIEDYEPNGKDHESERCDRLDNEHESSSEEGREPESEPEKESESTPEPEDDKTYDVLCGLPTKTPSYTYECGDGSTARKYTNANINDYNTIRSKYLKSGYTEYSVRDTNNTKSATFVGGDTYATVFLRKADKDLVLVTSNKDGKKLPFNEPKSYTRVCETTFTQPGLDSAGGMCEIIRIADGRFIIFDSGNPNEQDNIYEALCQLNGSYDNIRIAAWVFTHSHGDHYGGFKGNGNEYEGFASKYNKYVDIEYVLYAPFAKKEWDEMSALRDKGYATWNTIDYYFVGSAYAKSGFEYRINKDFPEATLVPVHAGQSFKFADTTIEILYSAEHLYIDHTITSSAYINSNNSSLFCRVVSDNGGAAIIAGDCETEGGKWVDHTYTTELKANIMQMTHHGMGTDSDLSIMEKSGASVFVWASGENKYNNTDRHTLKIKQYAARYGENILHGYGTVTRPLNHIGKGASGPELITGKFQTNTAFKTTIDTSKYNALVLTVKGMGGTASGYVSFTTDSQPTFIDENKKLIGAQGSPYTGFTDRKIIVYFGNCEDYTGTVTAIKIELDATVTSIQAFKV